MPYGVGRQLQIVPTSLNELNLSPNPFIILATMALANNTEYANDENYAESSAARGYVVATERSGQIEALAGRNVERAKKKPSWFPTVV